MARAKRLCTRLGRAGRTALPVQLTLDQARRPVGHGGWRPGAGRPRGLKRPAHLPRPTFAARYPLHVTLRIVRDAGSLRRDRIVHAIRQVFATAGRRDDFRVVEFNALANHVHLVVEAAGKERLARGMQGLMVRLVRVINPLLGRTGKLFAERYHARVLRTPREVRNVLRYVLQNGRHHAAQVGKVLDPTWVDPCSSGAWFDGWRDEIAYPPRWLRELMELPRPTATPETWLLAEGWRRGGPIAFDELGVADAPPS